jgi:hypothetical protein
MKQNRPWRGSPDDRRRTSRIPHLLALVLTVTAVAAAVGAAVAAAATDTRLGRVSRDESARVAAPLLKPVQLVARSTTGPTPPANVRFDGPRVKGGVSGPGAPGEVVIPGVPAYRWRDGCGPTAMGMIVGYWDGQGYDDLVPGDATTQTTAASQMIASHGTADAPLHYEDYSLPEETSSTVLPDRSEAPAGDEHPSDSVADFMHTSFSADGLPYGSSWSSFIAPGFTEYVKLKYPTSSPEARSYAGSSLTWEFVKAEIDAGRPMGFLVDSSGDGRTDHFVTTIGYREINGYPEYACWDTWSTTIIRWQQFRAMSSSYAWGVWGGFTFMIGGSTPGPEPTPTPTPTPTPSPTPDTTAPVTTVSGADDAWHSSSVTLTFAATDDLSGVASTECALDGGAWVRGASLTLALGKKGVNSGVHVVAYRSTDLAGNVEAERYASVKLDGKVPATSSNVAEYSGTGSFTLLLRPTDAHSGVAATSYALDGKSYKTGTSVQITGKGTHTVKYYSVDVAGNTEGAKTVRIVIK